MEMNTDSVDAAPLLLAENTAYVAPAGLRADSPRSIWPVWAQLRPARSAPSVHFDTALPATFAFSNRGESLVPFTKPQGYRSALDLRTPRTEMTMAMMVASKHLGTNYPFNQTNPGIGFDFRLSPKFGVSVGTYENSFNKGSTYAMGSVSQPLLTVADRFDFSAGAMLGGVTGYKKSVSPLFNWTAVAMDQKTGLGLRVLIIPSGEGMKNVAKLLKPKVYGFQIMQNPYKMGDWNVSFALNINHRVDRLALPPMGF